METNDKKMTWEEAEGLLSQPRSGGKVIGVTNRPPQTLVEDGVYLVISHPDKKSTYEKVG
ncbi:MAG: hypothetical protein AAFV88_04435 [Planctomycetota bacterium]